MGSLIRRLLWRISDLRLQKLNKDLVKASAAVRALVVVSCSTGTPSSVLSSVLSLDGQTKAGAWYADMVCLPAIDAVKMMSANQGSIDPSVRTANTRDYSSCKFLPLYGIHFHDATLRLNGNPTSVLPQVCS